MVTIIALIVIGLVVILFGFGELGQTASFSNLWAHGGFVPMGVVGVILSLQVVAFAFLGVELVGVTAGEAENPEKVLPSAINAVVWRILIFYIGALIIIMSLVPWNQLDPKQSPFVVVFEQDRHPGGGGIINFVVITAAASSCNSGIFSTGRMLYTLAQFGQAPRFLGKVNAGHVPAVGVTVSAAVMLIGVAAQLRRAGAGVRVGHQRSDGRGAVDLGHDPHRPPGLPQGRGRRPGRAEPVPHAGLAYHELDRAGVHRPGHVFPGPGPEHARCPLCRPCVVRHPGGRVPAHQVARAGGGMRRTAGRRSANSKTEDGAMYIPTFEDVKAARERIRPYVHRTPVLTSSYLNGLTGADLFFKCENFQKAGAFKVRGASNAVFGLPDEQAKRGVATHSSGNHALSLSYAAGRRGISATVVMPRTAPEAKKAAVRGYGGTVIECEPSTAAREAALQELVDRTGADFVHPYNDPRVIAGQGTCSLELVEDAGPLDIVIAPIGGGGMISGSCLTISNVAPETKIYAAEPANADDAARSLKAGHIIEYDAPQTVADGLKVPLRERTWHFVSTYVTDILVASEEEIIEAMRLTWQRMKIVIEPSSAVPLAAILRNRDVFAGKKVGVIVTGGNVDLNKLPWMPK